MTKLALIPAILFAGCVLALLWDDFVRRNSRS